MGSREIMYHPTGCGMKNVVRICNILSKIYNLTVIMRPHQQFKLKDTL